MNEYPSLSNHDDALDNSPLPSSTSAPPIRPAWNQHHPYSTRFKRKVFSANMAILESTYLIKQFPSTILPLCWLNTPNFF
jgi:hypothetical protein